MCLARAYNVADPVTKLIHTIGGGFFNEPKYYDSNRTYAEFMVELLATGKISVHHPRRPRPYRAGPGSVGDGHGGCQFRNAGRFAHPCCLGTRLQRMASSSGRRRRYCWPWAAAHPRTKPFVPRYATAIMQRADEIRQVFGIFRHLFMTTKDQENADPAQAHPHRGALPHSLRKALAYALALQSDYALLKYNSGDRPYFADVLKMVGGSGKIGKYLEKITGQKRANWPISKAMFEYLVNGKYLEELPPILQARQAFFATKDASTVTPELVKAAGPDLGEHRVPPG